MALMKCKMCGGDLEICAGVTVAECEFCGTKQTLPQANDEVVQNLFNRANALRLKSEFDKAEQIYEKILQQNDTEAEAHWGIVLCKYGIEYVEDPKTFQRIPTCHRTSYDAVTADTDYLAAVKYADAAQKDIYQAEAKAIDRIQKSILSIVKEEKPFDVFICYKETDENGKRTLDSTIANDIYHQLTQEGLKVFYAAITLEDKLGREYEPYIFAALNSAKVMLVIGTKPQYFTAVWVKNEWSRFLKLMKTDRSKLLIPCYKDMDAYELPEEFAHLQAQDMGKIGFINDVVRGIRKVTVKEEPKAAVVQQTVVTEGSANIAPLLKRAFMFLEDGDWNAANEYCEKVLDADPECAQAYLGKLMAQLRVKKQDALKDCPTPFDSDNNYQKALRFADDKLKEELTDYIEHINKRNENARLENAYINAKKELAAANTEQKYKNAAKLFEAIPEYKDAAALAKECYEKAEISRKDAILNEGNIRLNRKSATIADLEAAIKEYQKIPGWKNADGQLRICQEKLKELQAQAEEDRLVQEQIAKRNKKIAIIAAAAVCAVIAFIILLNTVIIPASKYNAAVALMEAGKYTEAKSAFEALGSFKDSADKITECNTVILDDQYNAAVALMEAGDKSGAAIAFGKAGEYKDAHARSAALWEEIAVRNTISAGSSHTIGLKADGAVVAVGHKNANHCNVSNWTDIVAISAGSNHTVGLKADGTVVAVGGNGYGQCDVSSWTDMVAISAGDDHTVGLKADGTVVAVGSKVYGRCDVSGWTDMVAISAGYGHTVGLKADGTVVAVGNNWDDRCDVSGWTDMVAISAGSYHTVGLKADGTVVAVGDNDDGQRDVSGWTDMVAISAGTHHTVGLKADGTVAAVGYDKYGQCDVSGWTDIVAISAGSLHTVGLKADGTVVAAGWNDYGQCDVSGWTDIKLPD